jgi:outer membrane autotransporter protein
VVTASFAAIAQYTASSVSFNHNSTLGSIATLSTDQVAVAEALDNACTDLSAGGTLTPEQQDLLNQCQALAGASGSDPAAVAEAIDEMLPDVAQTQTQTGQDAANAQFTNLNVRIQNLHAGINTPSFSGLTLSTPTGVISLGSLANALMADEEQAKAEESGFSRWGFFVSGNIGRGETDAIANAPEYDFDIKGLTAGVDYRVSDNFTLGAALGYTRQSSSLAGDQGSLKMEGWSVSGYATWYHEKDWYIDGVLNFASNDFRHRRRVSYVLPGLTVDQVAKADSDGSDISASFTIGKDFHHQEWNFGCTVARNSAAGLRRLRRETRRNFAGSGLALSIDDRDVDSLSSILGGKASWVHSTDWGVVMPSFGLEWQKEYQGDPDTFRAFLISDPTGTPILITGEALDDNYFRFNLGVSAVWPHGRSGFIQYDRIFARDGNEQESLTIGGRFEF